MCEGSLITYLINHCLLQAIFHYSEERKVLCRFEESVWSSILIEPIFWLFYPQDNRDHCIGLQIYEVLSEVQSHFLILTKRDFLWIIIFKHVAN